jgi:hypothetical protein
MPFASACRQLKVYTSNLNNLSWITQKYKRNAGEKWSRGILGLETAAGSFIEIIDCTDRTF